MKIEETVLVQRSRLDPKVWVAVPHGILADQMWGLHPGGLRAVQDWALHEYGEPGELYDWVRVDRDTWVMRLRPERADRGDV